MHPAPTTSARAALALLAALGLGLASCGDAPAPAPPEGEQLFRRELCAACHGAAAEGTWMGPPLAGLAEHWEREALADFLREPKPFVADRPRLAELQRRFPNPMVGNRALGREERLTLADWLLAR